MDTNLVTFPKFITKGIEVKKSEDRTFSGHLTVEVVDKQHEFVFVEEVMKVMDTFMKLSPHISDAHSNRIAGVVTSYEKSEIEGHPSILIHAKIHKADNVQLYDTVWDRIVTGVYKGLSMGGGAKLRENMMVKDGRMVQLIKNLELYEISVCVSPANPLALIKDVNSIAKSNNVDPTKIKTVDFEKNMLQCEDTLQCGFEVEKKEGNINVEKQNDNLYKQTDDKFINNMTDINTTEKTEKVEKSSNEDALNQLIKNEARFLNQEDRISGVEKKLQDGFASISEQLEKMTANPAGGGQEQKLKPKGTVAEDVGDPRVKFDTTPQIPSPSTALPSINARSNNSPGTDSPGLTQAKKADEDEKEEKKEKKEDMEKDEAGDDDKDGKDKKEDMKKEDITPLTKSDGDGMTYEVIKAVRPDLSTSTQDTTDFPTAYQVMQKAASGWGGQTTDAAETGRILMAKIASGSLGTGVPRGSY